MAQKLDSAQKSYLEAIEAARAVKDTKDRVKLSLERTWLPATGNEKCRNGESVFWKSGSTG